MPPMVMRDFTGGCVPTLPPDKLGPTMSPRAINTAFRNIPGAGMMLSRRPGFALLATLTDAGTNASVCGMHKYRYDDGTTRAQYRIGVTTDGLLWTLEGGGSAITIPTTTGEFSGAAFTLDTYDFDEANNKLFFANGAENGIVYRLSGAATLYCKKIGMAAPSNAPTQNTTGVGNPTGTFDFALTWYDNNTGLESSRSSALEGISLTSDSITLNRNNTAPDRATHWRLYVRRQESGPEFWLASSIVVGTTTATYNLTLAQFDALSTQAPSTTENNRPPSGTHSLCWHQSRMFYTDGENLWYSKIGQPEQVDAQAYEYVNPRDGERITALHSLDENTLAVFKESGIFLVVGDSPQNWEIRDSGFTVGSITQRVVAGANALAFWCRTGPVIWPLGGQPQELHNQLIDYFKKRSTLTVNTLNGEYHIAYDPVENRFLFGIPTSGSDATLTVVPFNMGTNSWEALAWDLPIIRSFATMESTAGDERVYFGSYQTKSVFEMAATLLTDGAADSTGANSYYESTVTVDSTTQLTIAVAKATFDARVNTVASYCNVIDLARGTVHRSAYTASGTTSTTITLTTAMSPAAATGDVLVTFDLPVMQWETSKTPYSTNKWDVLELELGVAASGDTRMMAALFLNHTQTASRVYDVSFNQTMRSETGTDGAAITGAEDYWQGRVQRAAKQWWWRMVWWLPGVHHFAALIVEAQERGDKW